MPDHPALRAALRRWREVLAALALAALALLAALATFGVTRWIALAAFLAALALAFAALQRLRFARGGGGRGVVRVVERRLEYWGPLSGGAVDLDDLRRLDLDPGARPAHWLLSGPQGVLAVPVDAEGADALLGLFAALPGLSTEAMLAALRRPPGPPETLWRAAGERLGPPLRAAPRLH